METIRLIFFVIRLLLETTPFLIKYAWTRSPITVTFLFASLLFLLHLSLIIVASQTSNTWQQTINHYFQDVNQFEQEQRLEQIQIWEQKLEQQPTHRDVLLKLAQLHCQNEDLEACQEYWQQAAEIDPNHPAVIEFQQVYISN